MSPAWRMSTDHPHPTVWGEPARSQVPLEASHRTFTTKPAEAARIGVPREAPRSTPLWLGRCDVRQPDQTGASTGRTHPPAGGTTCGRGLAGAAAAGGDGEPVLSPKYVW